MHDATTEDPDPYTGTLHWSVGRAVEGRGSKPFSWTALRIQGTRQKYIRFARNLILLLLLLWLLIILYHIIVYVYSYYIILYYIILVFIIILYDFILYYIIVWTGK